MGMEMTKLTQKQMYEAACKLSASDVLGAGYSASDVLEFEKTIPLVETPYTKILSGIKTQERIHKQSTFGPEYEPTPEANICKTPMCTAGDLVNLGGAAGWELKKKFGFRVAASLIHYKAYSDLPPQNFDSIPQEWALAYIKHMAKVESGE